MVDASIRAARCVALASLFGGCGDASHGDTTAANDGIGEGETANVDSGADEPSNATDTKLDVGGDSEGNGADEAGPEAGCQRVDFLFVIDSSISMASNQGELVASFPAFVQTIVDTLVEVDSYHVGVVTSDAYGFNEAGCTALGALVTQTGGANSSAQMCGPFAQGRYMSETDDLSAAFSCAALVGTGGDNDERMMGAALAAISPELNAVGACNEGFIRDDALLVMVLITDEDDPGSCGIPGIGCTGSPGDPASWNTEVLAGKQHPENVVVLSLTRGAPDNVCAAPGLAEIDAVRIMAFAQLFQANGFRGDICAPFGPFFAQAVELIDSACEGFIPPG